MEPWNEQGQMLECIAVEAETHNVMTFSFQAADRSWFRYAPGQFVTLELPIGPESLLRTYSLASSPSRPLSISITVKAQPGSIGGRWMFNHVAVGTQLKAWGPSGSFSIHSHSCERYLFISAGSGITPIMSMTRWLYDIGCRADVVLINCAKRPSDLIFRAELEHISVRSPSIRLAWIVGQPDASVAWTGCRGRLSAPMLSLIAPDFAGREVFCCGPEGFMRGVRGMLSAAGFDMSHYHEESFHAPRNEALPVFERPLPEGGNSRVFFTASGVELACSAADTILQIARANGVSIPSGCQLGLCGTCKVRCLSGETEMSHKGGIRDEEIAEGFVLACCTRPLGYIEVAV
jgi:ferredoxin-NADP reductase